MTQDDTNTTCSAGDPLDVTRSIIDRNIARLEESILALKSRRNELSPISRLPAELLCNIFSLSILRGPESWTNFSQVSQHWRSLALSAPELWTNIPLGDPRWAQEMLIRSKMAKLTIGSGFSTSIPETAETIRSCLYEMNRVEEINLGIMYGWILEKIFQDLPKSAPQLHTLCIGRFLPVDFFPGTAFSIHEDFLYDTERLRRVELINCSISWDSRLLTGLTRLTLELEGDSLQANSSIDQFLHALQRMPALTDLHLKNSIPVDLEGSSIYPVVDLPSLRVLSLRSDFGTLTAVLRHITFPHCAILNLTCKENQFTQIDFSKFLSVHAAKFLPSLIIRSLSLESLDFIHNYGLEFGLWTSAIIHGCFPISQPQLKLVVTWSSPQPHIHVKALTCAFDAMSLPFLTQLRISTFDDIDSQTWVKTFGSLPLLEWACVQGCAAHHFLEALVYKRKAAEKLEAAYRNVPFPKLRYIQLERIYFNMPIPGPVSLSVNMLLDYLMERCERNAEVQVLRLEHCLSISSKDVERLKEIVVDVFWDGIS